MISAQRKQEFLEWIKDFIKEFGRLPLSKEANISFRDVTRQGLTVTKMNEEFKLLETKSNEQIQDEFVQEFCRKFGRPPLRKELIDAGIKISRVISITESASKILGEVKRGYSFTNTSVREKVKANYLKNKDSIIESKRQSNIKFRKEHGYSRAMSEESRRRREETCLERYGCISPIGNKKIREKGKETSISKYGKRDFSMLLPHEIIARLNSYGIIPIDVPSTLSDAGNFRAKCFHCGKEFLFHFNKCVPTGCTFCNKRSTNLERRIADFISQKYTVIQHHRATLKKSRNEFGI